jgi:hypothetical protein
VDRSVAVMAVEVILQPEGPATGQLSQVFTWELLPKSSHDSHGFSRNPDLSLTDFSPLLMTKRSLWMGFLFIGPLHTQSVTSALSHVGW